MMKHIFKFTFIMVAMLVLPILGLADTAGDLDYHNNVQKAVAIADASSGVCAEVDSDGNLQVEVTGGITVGDVTANTSITSCIPGTGATNLGKAEDAAHASSDTGVAILGVRNDTIAALAGTDGDYGPLQVDATGYLATSDAAGYAEDSAHSSTNEGLFILAVENDALADLAADGDYAALQVGADGALFVKGDQVEDTAAGDGDYGMPALGIRNDVLAALAGTDADYGMLQLNDIGALFVTGEHREDDATASNDYGNVIFAVRDDALSANSGTDQDYETLHTNDIGALYTTGEHIEDAAHASGDYGNMPLAVRNDALAALGGTDGDFAPLQVNASGALFTTVQGVAAADICKAEDAAHASSDTGVGVLAVRNDVLAALSGTDADYSPIQVNDIGAVFVTGEHVEDAAHTSADYGNQVLAVRNDTLAALGGTDGDYAPLQVDAAGALFVTNDSVEYAEDAAHTTADEGIQMLAVRNDSLASLAATDGDYTPLQVNELGALYTTESTENRLTAVVDTQDFNGAVDLLAAHGSKKYRIYKITIASLAAEVTTLTDVTPTIIYTAANGISVVDYGPTGLVQTTAATAVTADTADASSSWAIVEYSVEP